MLICSTAAVGSHEIGGSEKWMSECINKSTRRSSKKNRKWSEWVSEPVSQAGSDSLTTDEPRKLDLLTVKPTQQSMPSCRQTDGVRCQHTCGIDRIEYLLFSLSGARKCAEMMWFYHGETDIKTYKRVSENDEKSNNLHSCREKERHASFDVFQAESRSCSSWLHSRE